MRAFRWISACIGRSKATVLLDFNRDGTVDKTLTVCRRHRNTSASADMNGDGLADIVTYSGGVWTVDLDLDGVPDATYYFGGVPGDIPLLGDVDGDGRLDLVIYRDGTWYASTHRDGVVDRIDAFGGEPGDVPLLADLHCDGGRRSDDLSRRAVVRGPGWRRHGRR